MLEYVTGDLLAADIEAIAHGCNCKGKMGSGIALPIRQKNPEMYTEYADRCRRGSFTLGTCFTWAPSAEQQVVFNLATQDTPGPDARLWAVMESVGTMLQHASTLGIQRVGLPRIGAGIGGLKWEHVEGILIALSDLHRSVQMVVYTLPEAP